MSLQATELENLGRDNTVELPWQKCQFYLCLLRSFYRETQELSLEGL